MGKTQYGEILPNYPSIIFVEGAKVHNRLKIVVKFEKFEFCSSVHINLIVTNSFSSVYSYSLAQLI